IRLQYPPIGRYVFPVSGRNQNDVIGTIRCEGTERIVTGKEKIFVVRSISVVIIGRNLTQQERTRMRSAASVTISIVPELQNNVQAIEQISRLRPQAALVMLNGDLPKSLQMVERLRQEVPETAVIRSHAESS